MSEWIYHNSMDEYEERSDDADTERRELQLIAPVSLHRITIAVIEKLQLPRRRRPAKRSLHGG